MHVIIYSVLHPKITKFIKNYSQFSLLFTINRLSVETFHQVNSCVQTVVSIRGSQLYYITGHVGLKVLDLR